MKRTHHKTKRQVRAASPVPRPLGANDLRAAQGGSRVDAAKWDIVKAGPLQG